MLAVGDFRYVEFLLAVAAKAVIRAEGIALDAGFAYRLEPVEPGVDLVGYGCEAGGVAGNGQGILGQGNAGAGQTLGFGAIPMGKITVGGEHGGSWRGRR